MSRKKLLILLTAILFLTILFISHKVRSFWYYTIPGPDLVKDEWTNVLHGLSIRSTGIPAAWSDLRYYYDYQKLSPATGAINLQKFNIHTSNYSPQLFASSAPKLLTVIGQYDFGAGPMHTLIVQPYLDHPPFGALVLSSLVPGSVKIIDDLKSIDYRITSLWLASLTTVLIFLLGWQVFKNPVVGVIAGAVYATGPTFLISSRMALLENVLIPIELIVLNLLVFAQDQEKKKFYKFLIFGAGVFSGLAFLTKTTGLAVILAGVTILIIRKNTLKNILLYIIPAIVVSSFYFIWGALLSFNLFLGILDEQSNRRIFIGSLNFLTSMIKFGLKGFPIDGWWIGGFLSLGLIKMSKELMPVGIMVISLLFMILFGGASGFAWYVLPLVPLMCLMTGQLFWLVATKPTTLLILIFFLVFFFSSFFWGYGVRFAAPTFINHQQQFLFYKIILLIFFGFSVLVPVFYSKYQKLQKIWFLFVIALFLLMVNLNYHSIVFMSEHWTNLSDYYMVNWQF